MNSTRLEQNWCEKILTVFKYWLTESTWSQEMYSDGNNMLNVLTQCSFKEPQHNCPRCFIIYQSIVGINLFVLGTNTKENLVTSLRSCWTCIRKGKRSLRVLLALIIVEFQSLSTICRWYDWLRANNFLFWRAYFMLWLVTLEKLDLEGFFGVRVSRSFPLQVFTSSSSRHRKFCYLFPLEISEKGRDLNIRVATERTHTSN